MSSSNTHTRVSGQRVALGRVVEFLDSQRVPITAKDRKPGPYPYYGANGLQDRVADFIFDEKLVLLAEDGGYFDDPTRPISYLVEGKCWVNNHAHVLRCTAAIIPEFLNYQLAFANVSAFLSGTTRPKLTKSDASRIPVVVLELDEQRRIVELLSHAENIVRMRREAEKKAREIIPALFLDMFGDPATNPKGWREASLGQVIAEFRYGSSQKSSAHGDPVLRIPNVVDGNVDIRDLKFLSASDSDRKRYSLASGDILFVRTNGNPDYVGRCAVFEPPTDHCWLYASYLIRGRPLLDAIDPQFMQVQLSSVEGRRRLRARARTAAGQYNINVEGLRSTRIILPPLDRQQVFAELVRQTKEILAGSVTASAVTDTTFQSLLGAVFREVA